MNRNIAPREWAVLALILLMLAIGYFLLFTNTGRFNRYVVEDGVVEWITVLGLLLAAATCFSRVLQLRQQRPFLFLIIAGLMGVVLFFGAGEEISWGQRILGLKSPEYFKENNTQGETNLHNLLLNGVRINRWIFSFLLTAVLAFYVVLLPILYRSKTTVRKTIDALGVPLPKLYQAGAFVALFVVCQVMPHEKRAELLEAGTALLLFLIICFPQNKGTFEGKLSV